MLERLAELRPRTGWLPALAVIIGIFAAIALGFGAMLDWALFYPAYLYGFIFWFNIGLGSLALLLLQYLSGGRWGLLSRRIFEASALTLPLLAVLFLPIALNLPQLYSWARPEALEDHVYQAKALYLNVPGFLARAAIFFVLWIGLALLVFRLARARSTSSEQHSRRLRRLSAPGLMLYVVTLTFASTDWAMSLDYHWTSSIYGMYFIVSQGLATLAFTLIALALLRRQNDLGAIIRAPLLHDFGTLVFAFTIIWAYMSFAQYLIIWSGNLAEETPWYIRRRAGGWTVLAVALMLFHFAIPFLLLLSRRIKQTARLVSIVAVWLLIMRAVDLLWLLGPEFYEQLGEVPWTFPAAFLAIGGLWLGLFSWLLARQPLLPVGDPALVAVFSDHHEVPPATPLSQGRQP